MLLEWWWITSSNWVLQVCVTICIYLVIIYFDWGTFVSIWIFLPCIPAICSECSVLSQEVRKLQLWKPAKTQWGGFTLIYLYFILCFMINLNNLTNFGFHLQEASSNSFKAFSVLGQYNTCCKTGLVLSLCFFFCTCCLCLVCLYS